MPVQKSPGPADYTLKSLIGLSNHEANSLYKRNPGWTILQRPKTTAGEISPSAATYYIKNNTHHGKPPAVPYSIGLRPATSKIDPSSGPYNAVNVTTYKSATSPKYTIGIKTNESMVDKKDNPVLYDAVPLSIFKHKAPEFTIKGKGKDVDTDKSPGPMKYDIGKIYKRMVARQSPEYTISEKHKDSNSKEKRPGPANYDLRRYNPFSNSPKYTCASKHSQYEHVFILPQDNC